MSKAVNAVISTFIGILTAASMRSTGTPIRTLGDDIILALFALAFLAFVFFALWTIAEQASEWHAHRPRTAQEPTPSPPPATTPPPPATPPPPSTPPDARQTIKKALETTTAGPKLSAAFQELEKLTLASVKNAHALLENVCTELERFARTAANPLEAAQLKEEIERIRKDIINLVITIAYTLEGKSGEPPALAKQRAAGTAQRANKRIAELLALLGTTPPPSTPPPKKPAAQPTPKPAAAPRPKTTTTTQTITLGLEQKQLAEDIKTILALAQAYTKEPNLANKTAAANAAKNGKLHPIARLLLTGIYTPILPLSFTDCIKRAKKQDNRLDLTWPCERIKTWQELPNHYAKLLNQAHKGKETARAELFLLDTAAREWLPTLAQALTELPLAAPSKTGLTLTLATRLAHELTTAQEDKINTTHDLLLAQIAHTLADKTLSAPLRSTLKELEKELESPAFTILPRVRPEARKLAMKAAARMLREHIETLERMPA